MKNIVCIISGPTATGKTALSVEMAQQFGGEIVNFDSLLFYKELNIGSAKPSVEEMGGITHHLVGSHSIQNPINAADFMKMALPIIQGLHQKNNIVYLVGGSGFYLQALLFGMYESTTTPQEIMQQSNQLYQSEGIAPFLNILEENDPPSFKQYHSNDHYRIRRAVEHFWSTGQPFSSSRQKMDQQSPDCPWVKFNWDLFHIYLDIPKEQHFSYIRARAAKMLELGLITEVKNLIALGFTGNEKPLQSIGYKETQDYLSGKINSRDELVEKISIATRQLAKSQRTWFKKQEKRSYNPLTDRENIFREFKSFLVK